jgi:hypothetical protein
VTLSIQNNSFFLKFLLHEWNSVPRPPYWRFEDSSMKSVLLFGFGALHHGKGPSLLASTDFLHLCPIGEIEALIRSMVLDPLDRDCFVEGSSSISLKVQG